MRKFCLADKTVNSFVIAVYMPMMCWRNGVLVNWKNDDLFSHAECPDSPKGVVLSGRLDTSLARTIFAKAIEAGYIEEVGSHYSWKGTKALLAYMCGRIYCGDYPEYSKYEQKTFWEFGNGLFPDVELNALFEQTGIGQSRQNRRDMPVPNNAGEIDKFFQK